MHVTDELVRLIGPTGVIITLLTGPIGLVVSIVTILKGLAERREINAKIKNLELENLTKTAEMPKIPREIRNLDFAAEKMNAEILKIHDERSKIPLELEKIRQETANTHAITISNRIDAVRKSLNVEAIEGCITEIHDQASKINSELFDTYKVFFTAGASRGDINAAYADIIKFIYRDDHRSNLRKSATKLLNLMIPIGLPATQDVAHTVDGFASTVSQSLVKLEFPKMFENGQFKGSQEDIAAIQNWVYDVRTSYERLAKLLGTVSATLQNLVSHGWSW